MSNMNERTKILVCFIHAHIGGAMTSLVNFLNAIDTEKFDVDVLFYENTSGRCGIKEAINILPQGKTHEKYDAGNILKKLSSPSYLISKAREFYYKKIRHNKRRAVQIMSKQGCRYSPRLDKEYDVAIAYELAWPFNYVMTRVKARKKIVWHHLDFKVSGLSYAVDKKAMQKADALVFVSEETKNNFLNDHPEYNDRTYFMPNLLSSEYVRSKDNEEVSLPFDNADIYFKLLTVARISFEHKGFDRAVRAFARLRDDGLLENVRWVIIGKGRDLETLKEMIKEHNLDSFIYPIGERKNPIPYMKKFNAFLLPSRHEGKPMVVTESFIMGLVPVVTEYTSAKEQIDCGTDGLVFDNNEEALYRGLKNLLEHPEVLGKMKEHIKNKDYGNEKQIAVFYDILKKIM